MSDQDSSRAEQVSVTIPSSPEFLIIIRRVVQAYFEKAAYPEADIRHIVLAVDEACSNVIKYAYNMDATKEITVSLAGIGRGVELSIRDYGIKPDMATVKPRDLDDVRPGGLGTHLIRSVMDEVAYDLSPEAGTRLTMIKCYPEKEGAAH